MSGDNLHNGIEAAIASQSGTLYFTIDEVAKKIGKSTRTVHSYVDLGLLACHQSAKNHPIRFTQDQVDAYFAKMERKKKRHS